VEHAGDDEGGLKTYFRGLLCAVGEPGGEWIRVLGCVWVDVGVDV
jgi:hypothetical protein